MTFESNEFFETKKELGNEVVKTFYTQGINPMELSDNAKSFDTTHEQQKKNFARTSTRN